MDMTNEALRKICIENNLYRTPHLNDKLYANFKGFRNLNGLEEYTNLKALFLEGNALDSLAGMPLLKHLRCLYLQQNGITDLAGLQVLESLDTLNVSSNRLTKLEHLSACTSLTTVIATNNILRNKSSIEDLAHCKSLQSLDLQHNQLEDPDILDIITCLPNLKCLYLTGNPVVSKIKNYRKTVVSSIQTLTYLDDRPVFDLERKCAEAWATGGIDAERKARAKHKEEEAARDRANFEYLQAIRSAGWQKRRLRLGLQGEGDPSLDDLSDSEWEFTQDPPELIAARDKLAAYTYRSEEEEPADLREARMQLAEQGSKITEGQWASSSLEDAQVYLTAVKESQASLVAELNSHSHSSHDTNQKILDQQQESVLDAATNQQWTDELHQQTSEPPPLEKIDLNDLD